MAIDRTAQRFTSAAQPEPDVLVLHTTEGMGWPGYSGGTEAPHATIRAVPGNGVNVREHIPFTQYAKALMNKAGGVETNRRGVVQVELVGTCDPAHRGDPAWFYWPDADDTTVRALAEYLRPILSRYGIPLTAPKFLPYPSSYGSRSGQRMTGAQWNAFHGICGHQHVPENDHGDPGAFPIAKLLDFLKPAPPKPAQPATLKESPAVAKDTNYAHAQAKAAAYTLEHAARTLGLPIPPAPVQTGTGDAFYAHYWSKRANVLATLIDTSVTTKETA